MVAGPANSAATFRPRVVEIQIEEVAVSASLRLALIIGLVACSGKALASEDSLRLCVDVSKPKAVVAARHGHWIELNAAQWQFLRGVYAMDPDTPSGLPYGDHAVLARFDGDSRGMVFFVDGNKACTPLLAPAELLSMMDEVATKTIKHEGAGL
jgi:hypothetical protein